MSDYPHGHDGHSGWYCEKPECVARIEATKATVDKMMKDAYVVKSEHSMTITNMKPGGWVQNRTGDLVGIEYAKSLNRAQRRKEGIKL